METASKQLLKLDHALAERPSEGLPEVVARAGTPAETAWRDFFEGRLARNENTRIAYERAVRRFLAWVDEFGLELHAIRPGDVGTYLKAHTGSPATKKQHLAALRRYFNLLVERHICLINPAAGAETERLEVIEGRTPEITAAEIRALFASIDIETLVGLRDRAALATLVYTAARAGAVARLRLRDYHGQAGAKKLRFSEKGGKSREIEVRHDLESYLDEYLAAAGMTDAEKACPLFRPALRRKDSLRPWTAPKGGVRERGRMTPNDLCRMVKRRMRAAGLRGELSAHSFRVATITNLIEQGIPIEDVQHLAGHRDARTTKLYDRTTRRVTRNLVERISF